MVERERDDPWIDDLRRAWRELEPRPAAEDLELEDDETRARVEWMRAAWSSLDVPEPRLPLATSARPASTAGTRASSGGWPTRYRRLATAAAILLIALWFSRTEQSPQRSGEQARPVDGRPITPGDEGPQLAALSSNRVELRSGPVRLILLKDLRTQ